MYTYVYIYSVCSGKCWFSSFGAQNYIETFSDFSLESLHYFGTSSDMSEALEVFVLLMHAYTYIHIYIYIWGRVSYYYYSTAARGLIDIYAQLPRAHSAQGRVRICDWLCKNPPCSRIYTSSQKIVIKSC